MGVRKVYSVYDSKTDDLIAIGTSGECAKTLGITLRSFYTAVSRNSVRIKKDFAKDMEYESTPEDTFGNRMKRCRQKLNLTQKEFAKKSGIHYESVGLYEQGKREPSLFNASCIAVALGVSLDYLAGIKDGGGND